MDKEGRYMIPKVIHYCWFGGPQPEKVTNCINSWKSVLKDYKIVRHDESNTEFTEYMQHLYDTRQFEFLSDIARLRILKDNPGIYLDSDMYFLKEFTEQHLSSQVLLGAESPRIVGTGVIGVATANNELICKWLDLYSNMVPGDKIKEPNVKGLTRILRRDYGFKSSKTPYWELDGQILICSPDHFTPISWDHTKEPNFTEHTICIHEWTGNWNPKVKESLDAVNSKYSDLISQIKTSK